MNRRNLVIAEMILFLVAMILSFVNFMLVNSISTLVLAAFAIFVNNRQRKRMKLFDNEWIRRSFPLDFLFYIAIIYLNGFFIANDYIFKINPNNSRFSIFLIPALVLILLQFLFTSKLKKKYAQSKKKN